MFASRLSRLLNLFQSRGCSRSRLARADRRHDGAPSSQQNDPHHWRAFLAAFGTLILLGFILLVAPGLNAQTQPTSVTISPSAPFVYGTQTLQFGAQSGSVLNSGEATSIATGLYHTCAVQSNGTVKCWGYNDFGFLGDGTTTQRFSPVAVLGVSGAVAVTAGNEFTCALLGDGTVQCWGYDSLGELGNAGAGFESLTAVAVTGLSGVTAISSGDGHTCALISDGTVKCWGSDGNGQLGDGTSGSYSSTPLLVSGLSGVTAIAAAGSTSCAVLSGGSVKCWGTNNFGQLGNGSTTNSNTPVPVNSLTGVTAVEIAYDHSCALISGGTVKCWGNNSNGELGNGTTTSSSTPVSVTGLTTATLITNDCALLSDGTAKCWGDNFFGQLGNGLTTDAHSPVVVTGLSGAIAIAADEDDQRACAVLSDGSMRCWGNNNQGELGDGTTNQRTTPVAVIGGNVLPRRGARQISAGNLESCALTSDGTMQCWGYNDAGQLGNGTTTNSSTPVGVSSLSGVKAIREGVYTDNTCALLSGGGVECWGYNPYGNLGNGNTTNSSTPVVVEGVGGVGQLSGVTAITPGGWHSCAVLSGGTVNCWGYNASGQLGNGTTTNSTTPVVVKGVGGTGTLTGASAIGVGFEHTCALLTNGTVDCWGYGADGELGNGALPPSHTPVGVSGLSGATAIAVGDEFSCALISGGTVECWGSNANGQLGNGSTTNSDTPVPVSGLTGVTAIAAGGYHACALLSNGTAECWGENIYGQVGNGTTNPVSPYAVSTPVVVAGLSGATAIATGGFHTCALLSNGTMQCWGYNLEGQIGNGTMTNSTTPVATNALVPSVVWSSSNTAAATIDPVTGLASALAAGTATITATYGAINANTLMTVGPNNSAPMALSVSISGTPATLQTLTGVYTYFDADGDLQGSSIFAWLRDGVVISGATADTYIVQQYTDTGHVISFEVTPVALTGVPMGSTAQSSGITILNSAPTATNVIAAGSPQVGQILTGEYIYNDVDPDTQGASVFAWLRDGVAISGATNQTYAVSAADLGHAIAFRVTPVALTGTSPGITVTSASVMIIQSQTQPTSVTVTPQNPAINIGQTLQFSAQSSSTLLLGEGGGIAAGSLSSCALLANGTVQCWGYNAYGQLGNGTTTDSTTPVIVTGLSGATSVSAGNTSCALLSNGTMECWGYNSNGQLGNGTTTNSSTPVVVKGVGGAGTLSGVVSFSVVDGNHVCALLSDGTVKCWGSNFAGQLGNGTTVDSSTPVAVTLPNPAITIATNNDHSCAVLSNGTLYCWGWNPYGQLGNGTTTNSSTPVQVKGVGGSGFLTGVTSVANGDFYTCALLTGGTADCWGFNYDGVLGNGTTTQTSTPVAVSGLTGITALTAGDYHTCALLSNGTVQCWGENNYYDLGNGTTTVSYVPTPVLGLSGVAAISSGFEHTCALLSNGSIQCWGNNYKGQLGDGALDQPGTPVPVTGSNALPGRGALPSISAGDGSYHSCTVISDGTVKCWGGNGSGELGDGTNVNRSSPVSVVGLTGAIATSSGSNNSCALLSGGTVECWGFGPNGELGNGGTASSNVPVVVTGISGATAIATGSDHSCALFPNGTIQCWGANGSGQLGNGTTTRSTTPVPVTGLGGAAIAIAGGGLHTCALLVGGSVQCWGYNNNGELGDGTTTQRNSPVTVTGSLASVAAIAAGTYHTCALLANGTMKCWGQGGAGQLGNGSTSNVSSPAVVTGMVGASRIAAGYWDTCAVLAAGTMQCWGYNSSGQVGDGTTTQRNSPVTVSGLTGATDVAVGIYHACATLADGTVKCWGDSSQGQLGTGSFIITPTPTPVATSPLVPSVGWTSSNTGVATIDPVSGLATAVAAGSTTITATYGSLSANSLLTVIAPNSPPTASNVTITGNPFVGQVLSGSYIYNDVDGDPQGTSTFRWLRDGSATGNTSTTYTVLVTDIGHVMKFEVTPVAATGVSQGVAVQSSGVTILNSAPVASNVTIGGTPLVGQILSGNYTYNDVDGDAQGTSTFRWLRNGTAIGGATGTKYILVAADSGQVITFEVTPAAVTGTSPGASVQSTGVTVLNSPPTATIQFAYVANVISNNISAYAINAGTGVLTAVAGSPFSTGASTFPSSVTVDPTGKFAYVANNGSNNVSAYTINAGTGALTAVGGSPFATGAGTSPSSVTVDPTGKFAYVANFSSSNVSAFSINPGNGALTAVSGSPFSLGSSGAHPQSVTVDPTGKFVYVGNGDVNTVSAFSINAGNGALTAVPGSPFTVAGPVSVTVDPTGKFLYVANELLPTGTVSAFTINPGSGALTAVAGSPFAAGTQADSVTVDLTGKFVYVANLGSNTVSAFMINAGTGALTAVGSPVAAGTEPSSVTTDPTGKFAYVVNSVSSGLVSGFTINASTGALTAISGSPFPAGSSPSTVMTVAEIGASITGTPNVGQLLTGHYIYSDLDGDLEGTSTFRWLRDGVAIGGATSITYTTVVSDSGHVITFEVTPVAQTGTSPGAPTTSAGVTILNSAPVASNVTISGTPNVGQNLTGTFTYSDVDGDPQGTSTFRWLRDGVATGNTTTTYTVLVTDVGHVIEFEVTPVAATGASPGAAVTSAGVTITQSTTTISINNLPVSPVFGGNFTPTYAYTGDGATSTTSSTTTVCTVTSNVVNFVGVGTCTLTAHAAAGTIYAAVDGTPQSFTIGQATTTVSVNNIPGSAAFGGSFTPTFAYTGDGTTSATSSTLTICTVTSGVVNFIGVGQCTLTAHATAGTHYAAVDGSAQPFTIGQATTTVSINNIPGSAAFGGSFTPAFTYTGDGATSATSSTLTICTVTSGVVNFIGVGQCTLTAHATAGTHYAAVDGSAQSFTIGQATTTVSINNIPGSAAFGGSFTPTFGYTGDGTTSATSSTLTICTVTSGVVNFIGVGQCTLTAHATAGTHYTAVDGSAQSFTIGQATTTVSINNIPGSAAFGGSFTPTFGYTGDGTTFATSSTLTICTVTSGVVNFIGVGQCTLTAHATPGANYSAADGSAQSFSVYRLPVVTSANSATFVASINNSFTVTATGVPVPALSYAGTLPTGVTFTDNLNGTGTLSGVTTQSGPFPITFTATNVAGSIGQSFVLTVNQPVAVVPPPSMVAWWPGDGNTNDIIGGINGTLLGGASFAPAEVGQGFTFSNDGDGVTIPDSGNFDVQNPGFTADFWVSGNKNQTSSLSTILEKSHGFVDSTGWAFHAVNGTGIGYFSVGEGGAPGDASEFATVFGTTDILDGNFHLVAGTWDGANVALYIDGVLQGTLVPLATPANNTRPVNIGFTWGGGTPQRFFKGTVDEVEIFNRALSATEIQAIYTAGSAGKRKPANITPTAGTPQSAPVGTAFGTNLKATVTDTNSNPVPNINVTFTAPASGASGTFAGNVMSVTVATDSSGIATAPVFTTNSTAGAYSVTASTGVGSASFTLTNTQAPTITSANSTTFTAGIAGTFTVTSTGFPTPTISESGSLPGTVAFVDNGDGTGTLSGVPNAGGPFIITFTASNGVSPDATQSFTLTVSPATLQSIAVTPANPSVAAGESQQFTATGTYSDNSTQNLTASVTWASGTTATATINTAGLAHAVATGTSTISATLGGVSGSTVLTVTAATLQSIAVTPVNPSVAAGGTQQFTATGTYSDSSTQNLTASVTWASGTTATATINTAGLAHAVATGTSTISATLGGVSGSTVLTVTAATLQSIAVTPANPSVAAGGTQQFTATGTYSDNSTQNLTASVTWASGTTATATINTAGLAHAVATGTSTISATLGGVSGSTVLTVTAATLQSIAVTPANPSVAAGGSQQFTATGTYSDNSTQNLTGSVTWASGTTGTATINTAGLAHAVATGTSTISATLGGVSGSTVLTVTAATLQSIAVTPANPSVAAGGTQQFTATGTYSDNSTQNLTASVTWASGTTATATINTAGLAHAVATGTSTISATLGGVSGSTVLTVTAATLQSIAVTPVNPSVAAGGTQQFTATGTYSDNSTQNLTASVTWASGTTGTATINTAGLAHAVATGTSTISATLGGVSGSTVLTVTAATLQSIAVTPANPSVAAGGTQQFTATGTYSDNSTQNLTASVTWASGTTGTATINTAGLAHAVATGTSTISATLGGVSGSTVLTVTAATLQSIAVTPVNPSVAAGGTQQFTATGTYSDNSTQNLTGSVTWASGTTGTATINTAGLAHAVATGTSTISATLGGVSGSTVLTVTAATLQSIAVTPVNPSVAAGGSQQFTATGTYSDNSTQNLTGSVTWASGTTATATINTAGLAHAVATGTSTISATLGGVSGSTVLTVTAATLQSIAVTPANPSVAAGGSQQFTATGTYSDNSTQNLTASVTWASGTTATATINTAGLAHAVATGTSTISATLGGVSGSTVLTVTAATLQSIAVTPVNPSVAAGGTQQFTATGTYSDNSTQNLTASVTWASGTTATATINTAGLAHAVATGTSTISATLGGVSGSTVLTVTAATLQSIAVTPANPSVAAGGTQQFTATGTYSDNSTQNLTASVTWASGTTATATINTAGLAHAVATGTSTISATLGGVSGSTVLTVTAATLQSIAVTPVNPSVAAGGTQQFTATGTYSDNSTQNLTASVTWASGTTATATINTAGLAHAVATGTSTISATLGGVSGSTVLTVTSSTLTLVSIKVTSASPATSVNPSVAKGAQLQFIATGTYSNGTTQIITASVTWTSSNTSVAAINSTGLATGVGTGTTTIKATLGTVSGSTTLTVTGAILKTIAVTPANPSIPKGTTLQFTATGTYSDGTTKNITSSVCWASSKISVAKFDPDGDGHSCGDGDGDDSTVIATGTGTSTITATFGSVTVSTVLAVTSPVLQSINVTPNSPSIAMGLTRQFTATGKYSDGSTQDLTTSVTWSSSITSVATITSVGIATGTGIGTSVIRGTLGSLSDASTLTVTSPVLVSVSVTPINPSISKGTTQQFTAMGTYSDGSTQNITASANWSSSNTSVATIKGNGVATGVKAGSTTIRAGLGGIPGTTTLTVTP